MQPTISIPQHWGYPRFALEQRTQQGFILGMKYYAKDSFLAQTYGSGWRYSVIPNTNSEELLHYHSEQI